MKKTKKRKSLSTKVITKKKVQNDIGPAMGSLAPNQEVADKVLGIMVASVGFLVIGVQVTIRDICKVSDNDSANMVVNKLEQWITDFKKKVMVNEE